MAERRPSPPAPKRGPLGKLASALLGFAFWVILGALGNVLLEWLGMAFLWPEEGVRHSWDTLNAELRYLDRDFPEGMFISRPARFAREAMAAVHGAVYRGWNFGALFPGSRAGTAAPSPFGALGREYLLAAVIATQIYVLRLAVMVSAVPVFLLAAVVAAADGFGQRDLRRFGGGRERGQVYHLARSFVLPLFTLPWILYLSWPTTVHPNWFVLPFATAFGAMLWVMTGSFKKYL